MEIKELLPVKKTQKTLKVFKVDFVFVLFSVFCEHIKFCFDNRQSGLI